MTIFKSCCVGPFVLLQLLKHEKLLELAFHKHFDCSAYLLKRLNRKELTSWPVGLNFRGLDELSLSLLKQEGTTADRNWSERKL